MIRSMVEHNVALIVGCMPGFAGLLKSSTSTSSIYRNLRSKLSGSYASSSRSRPSLPPTGQQHWADVKHSDDNSRRGRAYFYEMNESSAPYPEMEVSAQYEHRRTGGRQLAEDERGILRTTDLTLSCEEGLSPHGK